ncbi:MULTISPECIES: Slp family lipoprotein [Nitrosomonas]|uniref:Membrane protein n=1 Tax=Nitrosomonas communis TaxID=44574 RepID=A0A0F7KFT3_9PROT|nr:MULTISPECIES: Slp family lipoprotein [Nitrosomonas]AKH38013.1 membrane protein [Nitrosomonas communis]TYP91624.1 outer membrane lipoprotein [Nitrosomonas communis]UVS59900.1 Slp family lipoprotein [Nitrosomonas sp. PLL12]
MKLRLSIVSLFFLLNGCTSLPPAAIRNIPFVDLSYQTVNQDINAYKDVPIRWGGVIIDVENEKDFSLVQILFYPLDKKGYPYTNKKNEGRFVIESSEFLDPAVYKKDTEITVTGTIKGDIERTIGNKTIQVPLISATAIYLWPKEYRYNYYGPGRYGYYPPYPFGFYGDPYYYRGFYWPYPYRW